MKRPTRGDDLIGRHVRSRIGDKWTVPVVYALAREPMQFGELGRALGISSKVLTELLRSLERDGLIVRAEGSSRTVLYGMTPVGASFLRLAASVERWAKRHEEEFAASRQSFAAPRARNVALSGWTVISEGAGERRGARVSPANVLLPRAGHFSHVCIAVRDVAQAARAYAETLGVAEPPIRLGPASRGENPVWLKLCCFQLRNFQIELIEQVSGSAPYREFIQRYGEGVHHVGLDVASGLRDKARRLETIGGRWSGDAPRDRYTYADLDFTRQLGTTVQLMASTGPIDRLGGLEGLLKMPMAPGRTALAARRVSHIGIVVENIEEAARTYASILEITTSHLRTHQQRSNVRRITRGDTRITNISHGGVGLELIQPAGRSSPWWTQLDRYGPGVDYIAFGVKTRRDDLVRTLERSGGRGARAGIDDSIYVDLRPQLGLSIELHRPA